LFGEPTKEILPVLIRPEYQSLIDPPGYDMVQDLGSV
jgi:hypothetical protein